MGDKSGIRNLPKSALIKRACVDYILKKDVIQNQYKFVISPSETLSHNRWVEREIDRMQVATNLTDTLLHEIKRNALFKVSQGSENAFVDIMYRLIETSLNEMPIDLKIDITRNDRQSVSSKNRKARQVISPRGNKPDLMIRVFFKRKWNELAYFESGKWKTTDVKTNHDHKLARLCVDGYNDITKKNKKDELRKFCIIFGINVTEEHFMVIHGLFREKGIKLYLPIIKAKIPLNNEQVDDVENFIHALMILRNGLLVNIHEINRILQKPKSTKTTVVQSEQSSSEDDSIIRTPPYYTS